jgi:hypothetical protein
MLGKLNLLKLICAGLLAAMAQSAGALESTFTTTFVPPNGEARHTLTLADDSEVIVHSTLSGGANCGNTGFGILASDGLTVVVRSTYASCTADGPSGAYALKAGTYYFTMWNGYGGTYTARLVITASSRANDAEANDTPATALPIAANGQVTGHMGYTNGFTQDAGDYYRLTLSQDGALSVALATDASMPSGTRGYGLYASDGTTTVRDLSQLTAGTYYIGLYVDTYYAQAYGGYTLETAFMPKTVATSTTTTTTTSTTTTSTAKPSTTTTSTTTTSTATTTTSTTTTTLAQSPSASINAAGPLSSQTLTLQNIQIPSTDLAGGVSIYVVALLGNTVVTFGPDGWTTQLLPYQSGITAAPGSVTLLSSMDLSGLVGLTFYFGYGNGSGQSALNDMLTRLKYVHLYTVTAASSGTNLLDLSLWNIYGSAHMQGAAIELGDEMGGDFWDEDKDGNPYNVWKTGATYDSSGFGYDVDWMVSKGTLSAPFTVVWNGCLPWIGPDAKFVLGRKNAGFTNQANSPEPMTQEIYMEHQPGTGNTATLAVGTGAGATVSVANVAVTKVTPGTSVPTRTSYDYDAICGDFKLEWKNQSVTSYFNGSKIGDLPYASGFGEPFAIGFRSFANPIKVNSFSVTQP